MTPEEVLSHPAKVLTDEQRRSYFENGYLLVESVVPREALDRLRKATDEMVDQSRQITRSDEKWDLEEDHSADDPRLRRLSSPNDHHPEFWAYASDGIIADIVADLVGPNVKFHHSKLNFKWAKGGDEVKWHQDIGFWPHTNYSPLTVGTYLYDCGMDQGPLGVVPKSHDGPLYDQYGPDGEWTGCLSDEDTAKAACDDKAVYLPGPAGSLTIHNCRMIHGSKPNQSDLGRPLLLNVYAAVDAMPYKHNPLYSKYDQCIVRGGPVRYSHHDPRPCLLPPDWSGGYTSIFALQQHEERENAAE